MASTTQSGHIHILFADDDADIREVVSIMLRAEGYYVDLASDGLEAMRYLDNPDSNYDLVILDIVMPQATGYDVCKHLRQTSAVPVLFLTARGQDEDKVRGFALGGDDYLVKPFSTAEFIARVKAMLRRWHQYGASGPTATSQQEQAICIGNITIDPLTRTATKAKVAIPLTDLEYELLYLLASHRGQTLTARKIYESIWDDAYLPQSSNTIMVHIRNLRKKLENDPRNPVVIQTVWGKGYRIG